MARKFLSRRFGIARRALLFLPLALVLVEASPAEAQIRGYYSSDPNVVVDLSALGGPGTERVVTTPLGQPVPGTPQPSEFIQAPSGLYFPPPTPPRSRLVGAAATLAPQLRRPASMANQASGEEPQSRLLVPPPASAPAPAAATKPMPAPQPAAPKAPAPPKTTARVPPPTPIPAAPTPIPAAPKPVPVPAPAPAAAAVAAAVPPPVSKPAAAPPPPPAPVAAAPPPPTPPKPAAAPAAPAPAAVPPPPPAQTAARSEPPATTPGPGAAATAEGQVRILFDSGSQKLPDTARDALKPLVAKLEANEALRVQLEAYAKGSSETASQARRLSLSRALAVRSYLIEQGVRSTRMDVRALGNKASGTSAPSDRVDAKLVER